METGLVWFHCLYSLLTIGILREIEQPNIFTIVQQSIKHFTGVSRSTAWSAHGGAKLTAPVYCLYRSS